MLNKTFSNIQNLRGLDSTVAAQLLSDNNIIRIFNKSGPYFHRASSSTRPFVSFMSAIPLDVYLHIFPKVQSHGTSASTQAIFEAGTIKMQNANKAEVAYRADIT